MSQKQLKTRLGQDSTAEVCSVGTGVRHGSNRVHGMNCERRGCIPGRYRLNADCSQGGPCS